MTNITQREYFQNVPDVTRHLSFIIRESKFLDQNIDNYDGKVIRSNSFKFFNYNKQSSQELQNSFSSSNECNYNSQIESSYSTSNLNLSTSSASTSTTCNYFSNNNNNDEDELRFYKNLLKKRQISLNERLIKTIPIWYLPTIDKNFVISLLNRKPIGHFIITNQEIEESADFRNSPTSIFTRKSLKLYTIDELHNLREFKIEIDDNNKFKLENSKHAFASIILLIEYYMNNRSEDLSFKLTLPEKLNETLNIKQLNSLSLLEQDFWINDNYFKETNQDRFKLNNRISLLPSLSSTKLFNKIKINSIKQSSSNNSSNQSTLQRQNINKNSINKQSINSISTSDKDTNTTTASTTATTTSSSSYSSLYYHHHHHHHPHSQLHHKERETGKIAASDQIENSISCNNDNTNSSIELLSIYSAIDNKENFNNRKQINLIKHSSINNFNSAKLLPKKNANKRHSKSLDEFLWPWKRLHKSDSSKKKLTNFSELSIKKSINSINQQQDSTRVDDKNLINTNQAIIHKNSKKTKFQLFNNNRLTTFLTNLFHKSSPSTSTSLSSSSSSSFTLSSLTKPPPTTPPPPIPVIPPQQQQQNSTEKSEDQLSINSCTTYVNPFFLDQNNNNNTVNSANIDRIDDSNSIYSVIDDKINDTETESELLRSPSSNSIVYRINNKKQKPISAIISSSGETTSLSLNTSMFGINNENINKVQIRYTGKINQPQPQTQQQQQQQQQHYLKKPFAFKRSTSMIQPNQQENSRSSSRKLGIKYSLPTPNAPSATTNEYSEPFDLININSTNKSIENQLVILRSESKLFRETPYYHSLSQQSITTNDSSNNSNQNYKLSQQNSISNDYFSNKSKNFDYSSTSLNRITDNEELEKSDLVENKNKCVISSDYETVSDCLNKIEDQYSLPKLQPPTTLALPEPLSNRDHENSDDDCSSVFDSSITTYDILNERNSDLLQNFNFSLNLNEKLTTTRIESSPVNTMFLDRLLTFINHNNHLNKSNDDLFMPIKKYIYELAENNTNTNLTNNNNNNNKDENIFSNSINEFIKCINSSIEINPYIIMSNIRQFLNGMKNYLIKNSSKKFLNLIDSIRQNLDLTQQIFNIDLLIEECLEKILLKKLKHKIYYLLVDWLINENTLCIFSKNIKDILNLDKNLCIRLLGVKYLPDLDLLKRLRFYYIRLQNEYSPFLKLKYILYIINEILFKLNKFNLTLYDLNNLNLNEFLPIIIYCICVCNMYSLQIEIDYVWGLVYRQFIDNEVIYYLTLMSSACYIVKNIDLKKMIDMYSCNNNSQSCAGDLDYLSVGLFSFILPNDKSKTIETFCIPIKPALKCKEICNMIAFKLKIINNEEYSLYYLDESGYEKKLKDDEQPIEIRYDKIKLNLKIVFIYKHKCANIVWPKTIFFD